MATGTQLPQEDLLNKVWNPAGTGPSPTGDSVSVYVLPGSGQNTPVLGSGTFQGLGPNPLAVVQPAFRQFILDSVALGSASATGTTTTGLGGYRMIDLFVRFSSMTGTISTINIFVDSRLDGTNYINLAQSQTITSATGGTFAGVIRLNRTWATGVNVGAGAQVADIQIDQPAATNANIGWGDDLRIRRAVSGGTTAPIFSYTITVNANS